MNHYFYFGGLLIGFMWAFRSLRAVRIEEKMQQNHIWEIRSIYTILSLLAGHVLGVIFEKIYLMIAGVI